MSNSIFYSAKKLVTVVLVSGAGIFMACNNNKDNNADDSTATMSAADSIAAIDSMNAAAAAAKTAKKMKKGKASLAANAEDKKAMDAMKIEKDKDGVYSRAETMPMYPGGNDALQSYVENHINYTDQALDQQTQGTVRVSFIVDENGQVMKPMVIGNTVGNGLDAEAMRVVEGMPKWTPGTVKGKKVKTRLQLPITFQLSDS